MTREGLTVVTGAGGHLGAALVRRLLEAGRRVRVVDVRTSPALAGLPVEQVQASVLDPAALRAAFEGAEIVHHLAGRISIRGDPDGSVWATNVDGARNAAEAALAAGVRRYVHCASVHAHDAEQARVLDEASPLAEARHLPVYDRSKAAGEREVLSVAARGLDAIVLEPTGILGRYDFGPSRMGRFFLALLDRRMPALVRGSFDWVDVRDVADAFLAAETRGRAGERYLLPGHRASLVDLAHLAEVVSGVPAPKAVVPLGLAKVGGSFADRLSGASALFTSEALHAIWTDPIVDGRKAARELGHRPRPLLETVRDVLAWHAGRREAA